MSSVPALKDDFDFALSAFDYAVLYETLWLQDKANSQFVYQHRDLLSHVNQSDSLEKSLIKYYESHYSKVSRDIHALINKTHLNFDITFFETDDYPEKLNDAKAPSPLLYYQGYLDLLDFPSVSVVGTRKPTEEGGLRTRKLVKHLVDDGFVIMSGLAAGIDTAAHKAAIEFQGKTVAVIGTPLTESYPTQNQSLQKMIAKEHLLITQVPFLKYKAQDFKLNRFFFPERNKTMSALSLATIIVEAGEKSGSLIQARAALSQGRKLFILDNCFQNSSLTWPHALLKKGAIRVKTYDDIQRVLKQHAL